MNAEEFFNNGFGEDVITVHRSHVINLMTAFSEHYHKEQLMLGGVVGRSEQLKAFQKMVNDTKGYTAISDELIDKHLKSL